MKNIMQAILTILMAISCSFVAGPGYATESTQFLSGLFTPTDNSTMHRLMDSGLNAVMFNRFNDNMALVSGLNINKIGATPINPEHMKKPREEVLSKAEQAFQKLSKQDPIGYLIAGDLKPGSGLHALVDAIASIRGLSSSTPPHPIVMFLQYGGLKAWELNNLIAFYAPDYDIMTYQHPFMRKSMRFSKLLKKYWATSMAIEQYQCSHYAIAQAHNQDWFYSLIEKAGNDPGLAKIYPDGQLVRLTYYLGMVSGARGVFIYNGNYFSLDGPGRERVLGLAQAIEEVKPLLPYLSSATSVEYKRPVTALYGTKFIGDDMDILFLFSEDSLSTYHPWAKPRIGIKASVLMDASSYPNGVYAYTKLAVSKVSSEKVSISQDHPTILLGFKNCKVLPGQFEPDAGGLSHYVATLRERSQELASNIKLFFEPEIPEPNLNGLDDHDSAKVLLLNIDALNDAKRNQWQKQSPNPLDADVLISEVKTYGDVVTIPTTPINFYLQMEVQDRAGNPHLLNGSYDPT